MKPLLIIDCGHGGISIKGEYTTDPKIGKKYHHDRMELHDNGWFYEGVGNRVLGYLLGAMALNEGYPIKYTNDGIHDTGLAERVRMANNLYDERHGQVVFVSMHSNAGKGEGWEIWTSKGQTESDTLATLIYESNKQRGQKFRLDNSDGDPDKESDFYVLRNTKGIAVLIEHGFFDNPHDVKELVDFDTQMSMCKCTWEGIKSFYKLKGWINK